MCVYRLSKRCFFRCGKTTICQLFAALAGLKFFAVNCHLHMETSDFLGGLRPVRHIGTGQVRYTRSPMDTALFINTLMRYPRKFCIYFDTTH